jgi:hypothetical protein
MWQEESVMQKGELQVSGKDKIKIDLHGFPREVKVEFAGEDFVIPCNPHHHDFVEFEVHASNHTKHGFILIISWDVAGVRQVNWSVHY